jgi:DNA-binding transcriptional ArsR family regulator
MTSVAALATSTWSRLWRSTSTDQRLVRWRKLIRAALGTPYYQEEIRREQLREFMVRPTAAALIESLAQLDPVMVHDFFLQIREFRNRAAGELPPQPAASVWEPEGRVAVVAPWFRVAAPAKIWTEAVERQIEEFKPDVVAAPVETLRRLTETGWRGPARAIVALNGIGREWLSEEAREHLWSRFGVPVHEQFRGFQGELLAADCEAHGGMHVAAENGHIEVCYRELLITSLVDIRYPVLRLATGIRARMEASPCGCGRTAARLLGPARQRVLTRAAGA